MFVVVGLGNPGTRYAGTRHNAGAEAVELLADRLGADGWQSKLKCRYRKGAIGTESVLIVIPEKYMNLSGEAVQPFMAYFKVPVENLIVVHDEIDIPAGKVRLKVGGSSGGHNGLVSVTEQLGTGQYLRVRIGVGRPDRGPAESGEQPGRPDIDISDWVLGRPSPDERKVIDAGIDAGASAVKMLITDGLQKAQREFNRK